MKINWKNFLCAIMIMGLAFVALGVVFLLIKETDYSAPGVVFIFIGVVLIFCSALVQKFRNGGQSNVVPPIKYLQSTEKNY